MKTNDVPDNTDTNTFEYRRVSGARLAFAMMHAASISCFASAIGYVSYAANLGFGISALLVGTLMTLARIFDGVTDPLISMLVDKINTKYGKIRIFMSAGWLIESVSLLCLYDWAAGKTNSVILFLVFYLLYYIGYTLQNISGQMLSPVITNDPKQRPMVGVWTTIYNYINAIIFSMLVTVVLLPKYGNQYSAEMMGVIAKLAVGLSFVFLAVALIAISPIDKPENFVAKKNQQINFKVMKDVVLHNKALQRFIVAATSDKLAMQIAGQAVISTLLYGIIIGNMVLSAILNMVAIVPSLIFAAIGGRYTAKKGSRDSVVFWTKVSIAVNVWFILLLLVTARTAIAENKLCMALFVILTLLANGLRVAVSIGTSSMLADVVDYEAARSGNYMPGIVSGVYGFIDKVVSSFGALIATASISLIGYTGIMPQPTDPKTMPIVLMGILLVYGVPILGWVCTLFAMQNTPISKDGMVEIQKKIADLKKEEQ